MWLAGATGHPILPFHIEADRYWTARSWDRTQIPKPFSTVALAIGEPLDVEDTEPASLEAARVRLEAALAALEQRALGMLGDTPLTSAPAGPMLCSGRWLIRGLTSGDATCC